MDSQERYVEFLKLKLIYKKPQLFLANYFSDLRSKIRSSNKKLISQLNEYEHKLISKNINFDIFENDFNVIEDKVILEHYIDYETEKEIKSLMYKLERNIFSNKTITLINIYNKLILICIKDIYLNRLSDVIENIFYDDIDQIDCLNKTNFFRIMLKKRLSSMVINTDEIIYEFNIIYNRVSFNGISFSSINPLTFKGFTSLTEISIIKSKIEELPENIFNGLESLRSIVFTSNLIQQLSKDLFSGLTKLEKLTFSDNYLKNLDKDIFKDLKNLELVDFRSNSISHIHKEIFNGCRKLQIIDFEDNDIKKLDLFIFNGLHNLFSINFSDNRIKRLHNNFADSKNLNLIDFKENLIFGLDSTLFQGLVNIKCLNFSDNLIYKLDKDIFKDLNTDAQLKFDDDIYFE